MVLICKHYFPFFDKIKKRVEESELRKEYDRWQIEISRWNKGNMVYYIDCECGKLAKRLLRETKEFQCSSCGRKYIRRFSRDYVEQERE